MSLLSFLYSAKQRWAWRWSWAGKAKASREKVMENRARKRRKGKTEEPICFWDYPNYDKKPKTQTREKKNYPTNKLKRLRRTEAGDEGGLRWDRATDLVGGEWG